MSSSSNLNIQDAAAVPPLTVDGAAEFTQTFLTGSDTQYTIWLRGDNMEGKRYEVGLATDCAQTGYLVGVIQFYWDNPKKLIFL